MKKIISIVSILCLSLSTFSNAFDSIQLTKESNELSDSKSSQEKSLSSPKISLISDQNLTEIIESIR